MVFRYRLLIESTNLFKRSSLVRTVYWIIWSDCFNCYCSLAELRRYSASRAREGILIFSVACIEWLTFFAFVADEYCYEGVAVAAWLFVFAIPIVSPRFPPPSNSVSSTYLHFATHSYSAREDGSHYDLVQSLQGSYSPSQFPWGKFGSVFSRTAEFSMNI